MEPDNSTEKAENRPKKKKSKRLHPSHEYLALIGRLRYFGDFVFGGDLKAYAAAVGASEEWLKRALNAERRIRVFEFTKFVASGLVSAEWLFCGTGPMLTANVITDEISGLSPLQNINSRYAVFNTTALAPFQMPELTNPTRKSVEVSSEKSRQTISVARQIFISATNSKPIILFVNAPALLENITPIVAEMLTKKYLTGVAVSLAAAELDYQQAGQTDLGVFNDIVIRGAKAGLGLGESLGAFLANRADKNKSLLAAAYSAGVPLTVHCSMGESPLHFCPAKSGAELGAAYGATSYVDSLVFAEQVRHMAGDKMSLFLNMGSVLPGLPLFSSAMSAAQEGLGLTFNRVKISRITARNVESKLDVCVCGPYAQMLELILSACDSLFGGNFSVYTNKDTGEQFAAFRMLDECAERVRKSAKAAGKRKR